MGLNDVYSFNKAHAPTGVYSTNNIDVATSRKELALHTIWGVEIGRISQLHELKIQDVYTKR